MGKGLTLGKRSLGLVLLGVQATACGSPPTSASAPVITTVRAGAMEDSDRVAFYRFAAVDRGIVAASLSWTSAPRPGLANSRPVMILVFSGQTEPSETPPLTSSRTVEPGAVSLFNPYPYWVEIRRSGDCGCRVDYTLTLTGPALIIVEGPAGS